MPTTTSASAAAAGKSPTASDSDEYEYEYEYEEIEVEEEVDVEVEEEVSDEEEEEVAEKGEDILPPIDDEDHKKSADHSVVKIDDEEEEEEEEDDDDDEEEEEEEEEEVDVEEKGEDISPPIDDGDHEKGKTTVDDGGMLYNDNKPSQSDGGITTVNTSNPVGVSGDEVVKVSGESVTQVLNDDKFPFPPSEKGTETNEVQSPLSEKETKETNEGDFPLSEKETKETNEVHFPLSEKETKETNEGNFPPSSEKETKETNEGDFPPSSEKETKGTNDQDMDDKHQKQPECDGVSVRLDVPLRRPRSLSPGTKTNEGNKRQALVCEFFAKGWCIKGNSCRFLHIKEPKDKNEHQDTPSISAQMTKIPPLNHSSVWTSTSMLFSSSSSSWNPDSFPPTMKHLDGDYRSGSETKHVYQIQNDKVSGDSTRFYKYDWEPSKPFRSMFLLSQGLSRSTLYDPIRDSIDQPDYGVGVSKFSSSCQGPSTSSTHSPKNINPPVKGTHDIDIDNASERHSVASHDKDMSSNKVHAEKGNEQTSHVYNGDMMEASEANDGIGPTKKEIKVTIEAKGDEVMQRESKALKHFRVALIEFVKEIVRPTWREGNLSKDAHKVIVKKVVDKVLSTLPAENIPRTEDATDFYLSSCQPKLVRLVEGYIHKYGKS